MATRPHSTCWELETCVRSDGTSGLAFRCVKRTTRCVRCEVLSGFLPSLCSRVTTRCQDGVRSFQRKESGSETGAIVNTQGRNWLRTKVTSITLFRGPAEE